MNKPPDSTVIGLRVTKEQAAAFIIALTSFEETAKKYTRDVQIKETEKGWLVGGVIYGDDEDIRANILARLCIRAWEIDAEK